MCVLPAPESGEKTLDETDRSFEEWSAVLHKWRLEGKKKGKGFATRKLRLFFLCSQDMSLAECGPDGQGYEVSCPTSGRVEYEILLPGNVFVVSPLTSPCHRNRDAQGSPMDVDVLSWVTLRAGVSLKAFQSS